MYQCSIDMFVLVEQVYMLIVKWSDLSEKLIYRRYPEIHTFHVSSTTDGKTINLQPSLTQLNCNHVDLHG